METIEIIYFTQDQENTVKQAFKAEYLKDDIKLLKDFDYDFDFDDED